MKTGAFGVCVFGNFGEVLLAGFLALAMTRCRASARTCSVVFGCCGGLVGATVLTIETERGSFDRLGRLCVAFMILLRESFGRLPKAAQSPTGYCGKAGFVSRQTIEKRPVQCLPVTGFADQVCEFGPIQFASKKCRPACCTLPRRQTVKNQKMHIIRISNSLHFLLSGSF